MVKSLLYSASNDDTDFTTASGGGAINVGFPIVAIKPFRNTVYIWQNKYQEADRNQHGTAFLEPVTDDLGCVASDSVIEIGGSLLFLGPDGIRPIAGTDKIGM